MTQPPRRFDPETSVIAGLTFVGLALRLWYPGRLGLDHFDEGIYALAGLWIYAPGGFRELDPSVVPYAPPGLPILIGLAYDAFGLSDRSAILPSIAAGTLTIPTVGWLARRSLGPGAGAAASALAASATAPILYSRMALTDAAFLLAWLIALGLGIRYLERPGAGRAIAFGLAVGLAQNVKYNGWMAGAIVVAAALAGAGFQPENRGRPALLRTFGFGGLAAGVAAAAYWPWYAFVEAHGGYAGLIAHHQSYARGWTAWPEGWRLQIRQVGILSGGPVWLLAGWLAAWSAAGILIFKRAPSPPATRRRSWSVGLLGVVVVVGGGLAVVVPGFSWWLALSASFGWVRDRQPGRRVLASAFLLHSGLTPLYYPYSRLWLPIQALGWFAVASLIREVLRAVAEPENLDLGRRLRPFALGMVGSLASLAIVPVLTLDPGAATLVPYPAARLRTVMSEVAVKSTGAGRGILYARPSVLFYLQTLGRGRIPFLRAADLEGFFQARGKSGWGLLDEALMESQTPADRARLQVLTLAAGAESWALPESAVTRLDSHPGEPLASSAGSSTRLFLFPMAGNPPGPASGALPSRLSRP